MTHFSSIYSRFFEVHRAISAVAAEAGDPGGPLELTAIIDRLPAALRALAPAELAPVIALAARDAGVALAVIEANERHEEGLPRLGISRFSPGDASYAFGRMGK